MKNKDRIMKEGKMKKKNPPLSNKNILLDKQEVHRVKGRRDQGGHDILVTRNIHM